MSLQACFLAYNNPRAKEREVNGTGRSHNAQTLAVSATQICLSLREAASKSKISIDTIFRASWALVLSRHLSQGSVEFGLTHGEKQARNTALVTFSDVLDAKETLPNGEKHPTPDSLREPALVHIVINLANTPLEFLRHIQDTTVKQTQNEIQNTPRNQERSAISTLISYTCSVDDLAFRQPPKLAKEITVFPNICEDGFLRVHAHHVSSMPASYISILLDHFIAMVGSFVEAVLSPNVSNQNLQPSMSLKEPRTLEDLSMLPEHEEHILRAIAKPGRSIADIPTGSLHQKFRKQAILTPDAPAIEDENHEVLSYKQVDFFSDLMAKDLVERFADAKGDHFTEGGHGIEGAVVISLLLERSMNLIISQLACWKAGFAIVILDPSHPKTRNGFIMGNVKSPFVLTENATWGTAVPNWAYDFARLRSTSPGAAAASSTENDVDLYENFTRIAWVMCTSGSTGFPKSVRQSHANYGTHLSTFEDRRNMRTLLFLNPIAAASVIPVWTYLFTGGCLCIVPAQDLVMNLADYVNEFKIDELVITPSSLSLLLPEEVPNLKFLQPLGESIPKQLMEVWSKHTTIRPIYGSAELGPVILPTLDESNLWPPFHPRSLTDVSSYVFRPGTTEISPLFVPGELCFGTTYLSPGYIGHPEKNSSVYITNPYVSDFQHKRLYRSGDIGVMIGDGSFVLLGRTDHQIKVDGNRVDPGEIENVLLGLPEISTTRVLLLDAVHGGKLLVACMVVKGKVRKANRSGLTDELQKQARAICKTSLPEYMIPARFLLFDDFPMSPTSKTDTNKLIKLAAAMIESEIMETPEKNSENSSNGVKEPMISENESVLLDTYISSFTNQNPSTSAAPEKQQMLRSSFVENGGTSLIAIKLINKLRKQGWIISLADLYASTTLTDAAKSMENTTMSTANGKVNGYVNGHTNGWNHAPKTSGAETFNLLTTFLPDNIQIENVFPASMFQCEMLLSSFYSTKQFCLYRYFDLKDLDYTTEELQEGLQLLMESKPILRTVFAPIGLPSLPTSNAAAIEQLGLNSQNIVQVVTSGMKFSFSDSFGAVTPEEHFSQDIKQEWAFGQLVWRAAFLKGSRILAFNVHHALADQWCVDMTNEDLFSILKEVRRRGQPGSEESMSRVLKTSQRPSMQDWIQDMYGNKGLDGTPPPQKCVQLSAKWKSYLAEATPTFLEDAKLHAADVLPSADSAYSTLVDIPYNQFCKINNITSGALFHTAWALTLAKTTGVGLDEVTYYRFGGNRESQADAIDIEGCLFSMAPMRIPIDKRITSLEMSRRVMKNFLSMRSAEPYYIDQYQQGGSLGKRRMFGNTVLNHIIVDGHHSSDDEPHDRFKDLIAERGQFTDIASFCVAELDIIERNTAEGRKLQFDLWCLLEPNVAESILGVFKAIMEGIVESGGWKFVSDLL